MAYTLADVRAMLESYPGEDGQYADFLLPENHARLRHFKAGVNAAWGRFCGDLDRAEAWYEGKHNLDAFGPDARAFSYGYCYSAAYL